MKDITKYRIAASIIAVLAFAIGYLMKIDKYERRLTDDIKTTCMGFVTAEVGTLNLAIDELEYQLGSCLSDYERQRSHLTRALDNVRTTQEDRDGQYLKFIICEDELHERTVERNEFRACPIAKEDLNFKYIDASIDRDHWKAEFDWAMYQWETCQLKIEELTGCSPSGSGC